MMSKMFVCGLAASMCMSVMNAQTPNGPTPVAPVASPSSPFPPVNAKFFTATSPTVATVDSFLKNLWGYDENRIWQVAAILATNAPGISKVVVFVADKSQPTKSQQTVFYVTPDGRHAIADNVIDFGATPFADEMKLLEARANGAARGAAGKGLMFVEFSDLQCPHCKDAQTTMDQLVADFPQARVVWQDYPLTDIHPYAFEAAAQGVCVRKAKGDEAFFKYVNAVFDAQGALTAESAAATLGNAVTKTGGDAASVAACAKQQATIDAVNASVQLAKDSGVESTPTLFVNGQPLPLSGVPYEVLKKIIVYRSNQDGVSATLQPSLKTLK